jgi:AbrB family looped-hinge helix DNA binding protein
VPLSLGNTLGFTQLDINVLQCYKSSTIYKLVLLYQGGQEMKKRLSVVTRKGQITIPAEIRHALNIKEGDKVAITLEAGEVRLFRTGSVVAATAGALKSDMLALPPSEERRAAEQAIAQDVVARMNDK